MPKIDCPTCGAPNRVNLLHIYPALAETLTEVKRTPGFTAPDFLDRFVGIGATAINQRFEALRELGLVRRERYGHAWRYYPI